MKLDKDSLNCVFKFLNAGPWAAVCRLVNQQWAASLRPSNRPFEPYEVAIMLRKPALLQWIRRNGVP